MNDLFLFCLLVQIEAGSKFETFIGEYFRHQALTEMNSIMGSLFALRNAFTYWAMQLYVRTYNA